MNINSCIGILYKQKNYFHRSDADNYCRSLADGYRLADKRFFSNFSYSGNRLEISINWRVLLK